MLEYDTPCFRKRQDDGLWPALVHCPEVRCEMFHHPNLDVSGEPDASCPLAMWKSRLAKTGVGARAVEIIFADVHKGPYLRNTEPLEVVRDWLSRGEKERCGLLILAGTKGVGKTIAAAYALSRFGSGTHRGFPFGRYVTSNRVVDTRVKLQALARHPLLVVDQCGSEYVQNESWVDSRFTELVDLRYSDMMPTILVGNITEASFRKRYGSLISDRLDGDGQFKFFGAPSLRGPNQ